MTDDNSKRERFEEAYSSAAPPWDIGKPQQAFVEAADLIKGSILDAGCGTGENALHFAQRGHEVTGIDFLESPINAAIKKAQARGAQASFQVMDALRLSEIGRTFDSVIDCGLFHVFSMEDRQKYVEQLRQVVRSGGRIFLMCFSDKEPGDHGPHRITEVEIQSAFSADWKIESIQESRFEVRPDLKDIAFSEGGPFAWFCIIRRD